MKYQSVIINSRERKLSLNEVETILKKELAVSVSPNQLNTLVINSDKNSIGIGDLEGITPWVSVKSDLEKVVIIEDAEKLTPEAQNSLLKVIEEPPEDALVILITNNSELLLETILSRCITIEMKTGTSINNESFAEIAEDFLKVDYLKKLAMIDKLAKNSERQAILIFLNELLKKIPKDSSNFIKLDTVKKSYLGIKRGVGVKLALEAISILFEDVVE